VTPVGGGVDNLYLTSITAGGQVKVLSAAEIGYGHGAVGNITTQSYLNALSRNYVTAWNKDDFDIVLLCTVEAARSKYIYTQVNVMLARSTSVKGDDLKLIAQSYGHTQSSIHLDSFRPLSTIDYSSHYKDIAESNSVPAQKFRELFL
jgi:hypothetical protein